MFSSSKYQSALAGLGFPDDGTSWWSRDPLRAARELDKMSGHTNAIVSRDDDRMVWFETITNNFGTPYELIIIAGHGYPYTPPKVFALDTNGPHKWQDDSLCLYHPDAYRSQWSILEIRNMACAWCLCHETWKHTKSWPAAEAH